MRNGHIKRITDNDIRSLVLEIIGTNVSTTFITCPCDPKKTLAIKLPFLVMMIKNLKKYFSFEVQVCVCVSVFFIGFYVFLCMFLYAYGCFCLYLFMWVFVCLYVSVSCACTYFLCDFVLTYKTTLIKRCLTTKMCAGDSEQATTSRPHVWSPSSAPCRCALMTDGTRSNSTCLTSHDGPMEPTTSRLSGSRYHFQNNL